MGFLGEAWKLGLDCGRMAWIYITGGDFLKELPVRKDIRLKGYDYSSAGCYFITVCVKDGHELLWDASVGAAIGRPRLSETGLLTNVAI